MLFNFSLHHGHLSFKLLDFALLIFLEGQLLDLDRQLVDFLVEVVNFFLLLVIRLLHLIKNKSLLLLEIHDGPVLVLASAIKYPLFNELEFALIFSISED